jgi:sterol desaturase/sphingolipid hydroxylase (fatty acid hydroxylase superfamily)
MSLSDFAGGHNLHFFRFVPDFVNKKLPPGFSPIPPPTFSKWFWTAVTLQHMWASPNFVWCVIALVMYFAFPYDLSRTGVAAQGPVTWDFFKLRFPLWFVVTTGYEAFWAITLYALNWGERPFIPNRKYNWDKLYHDLFWSTNGIVIWTWFENIVVYLWASNRLSYLPDATAFSTPSGMALFFIGLVGVPLWREVHFYFAHRLLHYRPMFQQVHSLHHRNTDIEPFSGLTMHPVEHLYYFACILPSVLFYCSPFHFLWNGVHLLISPAASHSGYEDHFQADNFHYMHHLYFECNYAGTGAGFVDVLFGTFVDKFKHTVEEGTKARADAKSTLKELPSAQFITYLALCILCFVPWAFFAIARKTTPTVELNALISIIAGFGPVLVACGFTVLRDGVSGLLAPFDKKPFFENGLHVTLGSLFCSFPISVMCFLTTQRAN